MNIKKTTKLLLMPLLMLIYFDLTKDNLTDSLTRRRKTIINGILLGFQGDFLLIFHSEKCFLFGLVSFLLGHLLYIFAIAKRIEEYHSLPILYGVSFAHFLISFSLFIKFLSGYKNKTIVRSAFIYTTILTSLNSLAIYYLIINPCLHSLLLMMGTFLFLISDTVLAINSFYKELKLGDFIVMATYIPAQTLIAFGMSFNN